MSSSSNLLTRIRGWTAYPLPAVRVRLFSLPDCANSTLPFLIERVNPLNSASIKLPSDLPRKAFQYQVLESVSACGKEIVCGQPAPASACGLRGEHSPWPGQGGVAQARCQNWLDSRSR